MAARGLEQPPADLIEPINILIWEAGLRTTFTQRAQMQAVVLNLAGRVIAAIPGRSKSPAFQMSSTELASASYKPALSRSSRVMSTWTSFHPTPSTIASVAVGVVKGGLLGAGSVAAEEPPVRVKRLVSQGAFFGFAPAAEGANKEKHKPSDSGSHTLRPC